MKVPVCACCGGWLEWQPGECGKSCICTSAQIIATRSPKPDVEDILRAMSARIDSLERELRIVRRLASDCAAYHARG